MEQSTLLRLEQLTEQKLQVLRKYGELTDRLQTADLDRAEAILDQRQEVIRQTDELTAQIQKLIAGQPPAEKERLEALFRFEKTETEGEYAVLSGKLQSLKKLFLVLAEKEKSASGRLTHLKEKLFKKLERSNMDRKVMDFVNSTSGVEIFRGRELDEKS